MANTITGGTAATGADGAIITGALCTRRAIKSALKITESNTTLDTTVDACAVAASDWIERFCRQPFALADRIAYFSPGHDSAVLKYSKLVLPYPAVGSVVTLHEDSDRAFAAASLIPATDYYLDGRQIILYADGDQRSFTAGERTVKAVVSAGYATPPALLQQAAAMLAVWVYGLGDRMRSNVASESTGGHTVSYKDEDMPKQIKAMLLSGGFVRQGS